MKKLNNSLKKALITGAMIMSGTLTTLNAQASEIQRLYPQGVVNTEQFGFAQSVVVPAQGHYVFASGQFAGDVNGKLVEGGMEAQMKQTFHNLKTVIEASGTKPEHVVQIRVLIVDHNMGYLEPLHTEISALFGEHLPASTLIPVPRLALDGMLFEIEATLFVPDAAK